MYATSIFDIFLFLAFFMCAFLHRHQTTHTHTLSLSLNMIFVLFFFFCLALTCTHTHTHTPINLHPNLRYLHQYLLKRNPDASLPTPFPLRCSGLWGLAQVKCMSCLGRFSHMPFIYFTPHSAFAKDQYTFPNFCSARTL
jgi:hypothetical protein